jgi:ribosomal protein S18 acetylase RimI-like enzyme
MEIKIVDKNDLEYLYELNKLFENDNTKEGMEFHLNQYNHEIICIAYLDNIAVGYCTGLIINSICYKNERLDIESLFVKEEYRHKGIGNALVKFIEKEALSRNINHFHIITNEENIKTVKFYENSDYKKTGEILLDKTIK